MTIRVRCKDEKNPRTGVLIGAGWDDHARPFVYVLWDDADEVSAKFMSGLEVISHPASGEVGKPRAEAQTEPEISK